MISQHCHSEPTIDSTMDLYIAYASLADHLGHVSTRVVQMVITYTGNQCKIIHPIVASLPGNVKAWDIATQKVHVESSGQKYEFLSM